jgi:hypothetical protein
MKNKPKKMVYTPIFCNHIIFVTEEERYKIYEGDEVEALGIMFQSSFHEDMPLEKKVFGKELIIQYKIDTNKSLEAIEVLPQNYKIHIPLSNISIDYLDFFNSSEVFLEDILNEEDSGKSRIYFSFKKTYKLKEKNYIYIHNVEIKDIKYFNMSYSYVTY